MFRTLTRRTKGTLLATVLTLSLVGAAMPANAEAVTAVTTWHVPVLMYHRIAPPAERDGDLADLVLDPKAFDAQLKALKAAGWRTITAAQLAVKMAARQAIPYKTFVITIDDGRDDGYVHAFPVLKKYGFTATYYVIAGRTTTLGTSKYLTWDEIKMLQAGAMEIGNHTWSHADYKTYTVAETDRQVGRAQAAILANTGVLPTTFAYPGGAKYPNLVTSLRKHPALAIAFTTVSGAKETMNNRLALPRVRVRSITTAAQLVKMVYPYR